MASRVRIIKLLLHQFGDKGREDEADGGPRPLIALTRDSSVDPISRPLHEMMSFHETRLSKQESGGVGGDLLPSLIRDYNLEEPGVRGRGSNDGNNW
jgi:hypothetical protein